MCTLVQSTLGQARKFCTTLVSQRDEIRIYIYILLLLFLKNLLSCFGLVVSTTPLTKRGTEIKVKIAARQMRLTFH